MEKIKKCINSYPIYNYKSIIKKIERYKCVSFDVYDTLLKRDVGKPDDIFNILSARFGYDFVKLRKNSESNLKRRSKQEITLKEIYTNMVGEKIELNNECEIITNDIADALMNLELQIEKEYTTQNYEIKKVYDWCVDNRKKILIISDMYLPESFIREVLKSNGYTTYKNIYVSCEYGKTKATKELYKIVMENENICSSDLIHIGDSKIGDWLSAKRCGISTVNIARYKKNCRYIKKKDLEKNYVLYNFINNRICLQDTVIKKVGYEVYGPLLYCFSNWIIEKTNPKKTVLLFSRDCYVVSKAIKIICEEYGVNYDKYKYFMASRKSLTTPALKNDFTIKKVKQILKSASKEFTIKEYLSFLGIYVDEVKKILDTLNIKENDIIVRDNLENDTRIAMLDSEISRIVNEKSYNQYNGFLKYWNKLMVNESFQVVDIGWRCTMQKSLEELLDIKIEGFYFGVREDSLVSDEYSEGLYLNHENDIDKRTFLATCIAVFEKFFTAPYPSVCGYDDNGNILYECLVEKNDDYNKSVMEQLHEGALSFVKDYSKIGKQNEITVEQAVCVIKRFGTNPLKDDLDFFGKQDFSTGSKVIKVANPNKLVDYLFKPKELYREFVDCPWKIGFLKKLLGLRLPYYNILKSIYRRK